MPSGAFGEGFDGGAQVSDFGGEAGQGSGVGLSGPVFVDDGAQLLVAVEGCAADLGLFGDGGEGDRVARGGKLGADTLDPDQGTFAHAGSDWAMSASSLEMSLRCRSASSIHPRSSASAARSRASTRWAARTPRWVESV